MISQLSQSKTTISSPLNLTTTDEAPALSFSQLLKGTSSKEDLKTIQNGILVLSLDDNIQESKDIKLTPKNDALLSLLKNETPQQKELKEAVELNPVLTANMSQKELKTLVLNAKEYLRAKIVQSPEYKKAEMSELPKTLKGLAQLANKFGIFVSTITVEEVQEKAILKVEPKSTSKIEVHLHKESLREVKTEVKSEMPKLREALKVGVKREVKVELKNEIPKLQEAPKVALKNEMHVHKELSKAEVKLESNTEMPKLRESVKVEQKSEHPVDKKLINSEVKAEPLIKTSSKVEEKVQLQATKKTVEIEVQREIQTSKEMKPVQNQKSEPTALFKAQASVGENLTQMTQNIVATKTFKIDEKVPKIKADATLKSLLRAERPAQANSSLTADFVVDTARVIAPSATSQLSKGLESLLVSETSESTANSKLDGLNVHKSDSFEVKLNEAKQMIKYLSSDVKTAIEDYKSPFTRVKLQLNPQRLGEVDLTIVQRGKNLHINLSSNSVAINTLSMNVNELRVQLNNSGINNATLNFTSSSQSDSSNASQQQQSRHNERQAEDEYIYFENEEINEEILSSLEIIVPDYA